MKFLLQSSSFLCLCLAFASSARAVEPGWYLLAFGGEASASGASENVATENLVDLFESAGLDVTDVTTTIDDSDTGFGAGGGYQFNDNFALEFAYVDLGSTAYRFSATVSNGTDEADADVELASSADGPVLSALAILPIGERFSVFGRVGFSLMNATGTAHITVDGADDRVSQSSQKSDPMFGVGAEYSFGKHFAVRLSWDRYLDVGTENVTGDIDADLISLGLRMGTGWFR